MDLGGWLRNLSLEQYEAAFRENQINDTVLPSLTAEDLKDLGVVIVGQRRTLLNAIAALRADANGKAPPSEPVPILDRSANDNAERRQVTVMFSDLVGSTAFSARMDPEDLREVISAYQKCVAETVRRFGGFVAKYMGDGVLVYFGYPQAHEDDAERAVRAGLELIAAVSAHKSPASSTLGEEKAFNPRLQVKSINEYVELMNNLKLANPKMMDVAVPANLKVGLHQDEIARRGWAITAAQALSIVGKPDVALIDLRERTERERHGTIPGSLHVPYPSLLENISEGGMLHELAKSTSKRLLFYCAFGERSAMAVQAAQDAGLVSACHIQGGIDAWKKASGPLTH